MTKTHRNVGATAEASFHRHYAAIWGEERWHASLFPAMVRSTRYACLVNRYASHSPEVRDLRDQLVHEGCEKVMQSLWSRQSSHDDPALECYIRQADEAATADNPSFKPFPPPANAQLSTGSLLTHWNLDAASVLVASMLDVQPGDKVLDLCAAPGGKSIALAQRLWPPNVPTSPTVTTSILHSNEVDPARNRRLTENIQSYLPSRLSSETPDSKTRRIPGARLALTLRIDGSAPNAADQFPLSATIPCSSAFLANEVGRRNVGYDRVLVDAPCSSERHIIHAQASAKASGRGVATEMANWRPGSSKRLTKLQLELLMTALRVARVGATVVYATCSIEMAENDGVVAKVFAEVHKERKKGARWNVEPWNPELQELNLTAWAEKTEHGWIVLPDHPGKGMWGPLFFSVLRKIAD